MSRLALCLFFIAIFHNGILKVAHADETTTEGLSKTNEEEEVKAKPTEVEKVKVEEEVKAKPTEVEKVKVEEEVKTKPIVVQKVKDEEEVSLKLIPQAISAEPASINNREPVKAVAKEVVDTVIHTITATPIEEKVPTNKEGDTEDKFFGTNVLQFKTIPIKHTQVFFEIPSNALGQSTQTLNVVGGQIGTAVAKTFNTAKYLAAAPFGLIRSAVNSALDYE